MTSVREAVKRLAQRLLYHPNPEVTRAVLAALAEEETPEVLGGLLAALQGSEPLALRDPAWEVWAQSRNPALEDWLLRQNLPAAAPLALHVLSQLKLGQSEALQNGGPEVVKPLLAACQECDPQIAAQAGQALSQLTQEAAQDEVCRWVIEQDHPAARQAAMDGGFAPRQPQQRALFYLLTEQWHLYEQLDFDASLLRVVYEASPTPLRERIAAQARQGGWSGFVSAVAGQRSARRLDHLTEIEWEVILALLQRQQRWEELWRLAQAAPPRWSARLLRSLREADWQPEDEADREAYQGFHQQAAACLAQVQPAPYLARYQAALEGHRRKITALAMHPAGGWLASASADQTIRLWRLEDGAPLGTLQGHTSFVMALAVHPAGNLLISGGADQTIRLWAVQENEASLNPLVARLVSTLGGHGGEVSLLAVSPDGRLLASGDSASLRLWSLPDGKALKTIRQEINGLRSLGISPDGSLLVSGDSQQSVRLWSLPGGDLTRTLMDSIPTWCFLPQPAGLAQPPRLASLSRSGSLRVWNLASAEARSLSGRASGDLLTASPNGAWLAASDRANLHLWPLAQESPPLILSGHNRKVTALAFHPAGDLLASASEDRSVRLWQVEGGSACQTLEGLRSSPSHLVFSPAGERLAGADELAVHLWALQDLGRLLRTPLAQTSLGQWERAEVLRRSPDLSAAQATWLDFSLSLARWQQRFDVEVQEASQHILVGEFDIEIEWGQEA